MESSVSFWSDSTLRIVHGSADSIDVDALYVSAAHSHRLPSSKELSEWQRQHSEEDANFALVDSERGIIVACSRGLCSETCNMLLHNAAAEARKINLQRMRRSAAEKFLECLHRVAVSIRRVPTVRDEAIAALRTNAVPAMLKLCSGAVAAKAFAELSADDRKSVAFAVAQCVALFEDVELYDKQGVRDKFPFLVPVMNRESIAAGNKQADAVGQIVEQMITSFAQLGEAFQNGDVVLVRWKDNTKAPEVTRFEKNVVQSLDCVIEDLEDDAKAVRFAGRSVQYYPSVQWATKGKKGKK